MTDHAAPGEKASLLSNILAIIGLIILVVIVVWGLVHLAQLSSGWVSSLFETSGPTIKITAPSDATSGMPVTVSWDYSTTAAGSYAFLYQCQPGFEFAIINSANNTASGIPCGASFKVTPNNKSISILPMLAGTTSASVPYSVIFIPDAGAQIEGSATVTVHPSSGTPAATSTQTATQTSTKPAQTTTVTKPAATAPASTATRVATPADISVRIVSEYVDQYGNGTVTFNIANVGGTRSGSYYFTAQLPTSNVAPYESAPQAPLTPGSYIADTLHFTQAESGTFSVTVIANDRNQANNYASQWVNAPATYPTYPAQRSGYDYNYSNYNSYGQNTSQNTYYPTQTYPSYTY